MALLSGCSTSDFLFVFFMFYVQRQSEPEAPAVMPAWMQGVDALSEAVAGFSTMEEVMKYLEPERWQVDMEDLYKPTWQVVGKSFFHQKKSRGEDPAFRSMPSQMKYWNFFIFKPAAYFCLSRSGGPEPAS